MAHIVVDYHYFDYKQNIFVVYEDYSVDKIETVSSRLVDVIASLKNTVDITDITLCGNINYMSKIQEKMQGHFDCPIIIKEAKSGELFN